MSDDISKILVVDDEPFNLDILEMDLKNQGFEVVRAEDGQIALNKLKQAEDFDLIILDRMMPKMDGMQMLRELKGDPQHKNIPVIMQTAAGQTQQVQEGLKAGVYYYLIKPYEAELLLTIVHNALKEKLLRKEILTSSQIPVQGALKKASFEFRTLQDVRSLAHHIANYCPRPEMVIFGLNELMTNAIEHGNLNITYLEKLGLLNSNSWQSEVERRLELPENKGKRAVLTFEDDGKCITISIKDQGKGFDWLHYLEFDPIRMISDPHGRGIAITRVTCFPDLEYRDNGSQVVFRINHSEESPVPA